MRNILICFIGAIVLCCACNSTKKQSRNTPTKKYISVVENVDGYNVAYTEDGHTILYTNDSTGNYSVYYVKFENGAGKYGLKSIEAKTVMLQIDSTLSSLKSFVSFHGGSFCEVDSLTGYKAYFFNERLKGDSLLNIDVPVEGVPLQENGVEQIVKHICKWLDVAYSISLSINKYNQIGWNEIVYALEPTHELQSFDVTAPSALYDKKIQKRLPRLNNIAKELTYFHKKLQEQMINNDIIRNDKKE